MKRLSLNLGLSMLLTGTQASQASAYKRADFEEYVQSVAARVSQTGRQWHREASALQTDGQRRVVTQSDFSTPAASYWGSLYTPAGEEWMYIMNYDYETVGEGLQSIKSADITIYDADFNVFKTLTAEFALTDGDVTINSVQIVPTLTRKFYDINDAYEIMVLVHATTYDYTGNLYTQVYTLSDGHLVTTLPGSNIGAFNTAEDEWGEKYTMVFMREEYDIQEDSYAYLLHFDVYSRAGWSSGCNLEHTFDIDYTYIAGAGNYALPILVNTCNNHLYYALPRYEKPYFESEWSEDITPDNNFIIDLYDETFNLIKTTTLPMEVEPGALFSFPGLGELRGFNDMTFDFYGETQSLPYYIVGVENYITSTDDFQTSLYVYDTDGNCLEIIAENAEDYIRMSSVNDRDEQYCFYYSGDDGGALKMVNLPSCEEVASLPLYYDFGTISTQIDRVAVGSGYKYASSMLTGEVDDAGNVLHRIAWFNADGTYDRIDRINMGQNVTMAQVNISGSVLNPHIFNTDDNLEYMFLVKEPISETTSATEEYFRIYNDESEMLLSLGKDKTTGEWLNSIFLMNLNTSKSKLVVAYYADDTYHLHTLDLPLTKYNGGDGTAESPYQIASAGDLKCIKSAPDAYYELICDIDMGNMPWSGNDCNFTGVFDGKGHTIYNLNLTGNSIFGEVSNCGTIRDINIDGITMNATHDTGIIADELSGSNKSTAIISNVHICNVKVNGDRAIEFGGITSRANIYARIADCSIINADYNLPNAVAGGLVGVMGTSAEVTNALFEGSINAETAGGIAGRSITGDELIANAHAHVRIDATKVAGGIIGASGRTIINNCFVDGEVNAIGDQQAYCGGIAGQLNSTYKSSTKMVIENCISAAKVTANASASDRVAHRIVGFTSGDEMLVDWESKDPNVDWTDPSTYPYVQGKPEGALNGNLALDIMPIDSNAIPGATSAEGESITAELLTDDVLAAHNWDMTNTWRRGATALLLKTEELVLSIDEEDIEIDLDLNGKLTINCNRRYANLIEVESSNPEVITINAVEDNGDALVCQLDCLKEGESTITATLDGKTVSCVVKVGHTSITGITSDKSTLTYNNGEVTTSETTVSIYDMSGRLVMQGQGHANIQSLNQGIYIATDGVNSIKINK